MMAGSAPLFDLTCIQDSPGASGPSAAAVRSAAKDDRGVTPRERLGAGTQRIQGGFDLRTVWLAHSHQAPESSFQPGVLALSRETR